MEPCIANERGSTRLTKFARIPEILRFARIAKITEFARIAVIANLHANGSSER